MPPARPLDRAFFCPQCGHAIRPSGPLCPDCQAPIVLPPLLARTLRSAAEALVTIRGQGTHFTTPPSLYLQIGARIMDLAFLGALTFGSLIFMIRQVQYLPLLIAGLWLLVDALLVPVIGGTVGMRLLGLALVDTTTGAKPDLIQALLRWMGAFCHPLSLGLTAILPWLDAEQRGWPERLAGLRIVERERPT